MGRRDHGRVADEPSPGLSDVAVPASATENVDSRSTFRSESGGRDRAAPGAAESGGDGADRDVWDGAAANPDSATEQAHAVGALPSPSSGGGAARVTAARPVLLADLLRRVPVSPAARRDLRRRMAAPSRRYHGLAHIAELWARHRRLSHGTPFRAPRSERLIAAAIAFHDAIYDARRGGSEAASAALWRRRARAARRMPRAAVEWVAGTIDATADHLGVRLAGRTVAERARLWMLDLDLTPLGDVPPRFARNTRALRAEFAHLPEAAWRDGRRAFLARLARHPRLFRTHRIAARYEAPARANVAAALADRAYDREAGGHPGSISTRSSGAPSPATRRAARRSVRARGR
jgi:predicted metal-dependent HD superfamily phosphohydrolase